MRSRVIGVRHSDWLCASDVWNSKRLFVLIGNIVFFEFPPGAVQFTLKESP